MCREEGEAEAWVTLQLEETSVITDIDIGNQGAAFIEVQVSVLGLLKVLRKFGSWS